MKSYQDLLRQVLEHGTRKENRTGVDTLSTFMTTFRHDLRDGFPLLTTKHVSWKNIVIELLWFLSGSDKSEFLERHKCGFWRPWYNDDGTVKNCYGPAWRKFDTVRRGTERFDEDDRDFQVVEANDQIRFAINALKKDPYSRRVVVSAWAPGIAQTAPLPPCHAMFVFNVQNEPWLKINSMAKGDSETGDTKRLCVHLTQRSADLFLGVPYNIASYSLFLELMARFTGLEPGVFGHTMVDTHLYTCKADGSGAEYDQVPVAMEQLTREPLPLPRLIIDDKIRSLEDLEALLRPGVSTEDILSLIRLENYRHHPKLTVDVAV